MGCGKPNILSLADSLLGPVFVCFPQDVSVSTVGCEPTLTPTVPADLLCPALVCFPQLVSVSTVGCEPTLSLLMLPVLHWCAFHSVVSVSELWVVSQHSVPADLSCVPCIGVLSTADVSVSTVDCEPTFCPLLIFLCSALVCFPQFVSVLTVGCEPNILSLADVLCPAIGEKMLSHRW